jgi:urea transport system substrate-binding protein
LIDTEARAMVRRLLVGFGLLVALSVIGYGLALALGLRSSAWVTTLIAESRPPIVVGLIHSQTGPLAISEKSLLDAEILAVEEINARNLIPGRVVKYEKADGRSDPAAFADQARRMIEDRKADVIIGGLTAECRKAMLAVVESRNGLLMFPANFEGIERSPHVIYMGGSANQIIVPAVRWCVDALKAKRFFVIGSEEISSRCSAEIAKDSVKASKGELVGESYLPLTGGDATSLIEAIRQAKPDAVLNFLVGDSNVGLYAALKRAGLTPEKLAVLGFAIAEDELRRFPSGDVTGHYSAWSYFQSLDRRENVEFVSKFKARYPDGDRVVSDSMVAAYNAVMIWAQAVKDAGTGESNVVRQHFDRQSLDAPEGIVTVDPESRVAWRPFHVGKARSDGQFDVVYSISKPIHPETYVATRSRYQWDALLVEYQARWGGRWSSSEAIHPNPTPPAR